MNYSFIVYAKEPAKSFKGILGEIDLYTIHLLLTGGNTILQEKFTGTAEEARKWYIQHMKDQGIVCNSSQIVKSTIWMEVDLKNTSLEEFTMAHELEKGDTDTLAWRTFWYPCTKGTKIECLGFAINTLEYKISNVSLEAILKTILTDL
jgi:hypothetical protein